MYERVNASRGRILLALRRHLRDAGYYVDRHRTGRWNFGKSGSTSEIDIGRPLTAMLTAGTSDADAVSQTVDGHYWFPKLKKSPNALLNDEAPVEDLTDKEAPATAEFTLDNVVGMSALCKALEVAGQAEDDAAAKRLARASAERTKTGRLTAALLTTADHLPHVEASYVIGESRIGLDFTDGYSDLPIATRKLARHVREVGSQRAGEELAERFRVLDARRTRVLAAMFNVLREFGYRRMRLGDWIGRTHREFQFPMGHKLTASVEVRGEKETIRRWLPEALARRAIERPGRVDAINEPDPAWLPTPAIKLRLPDKPMTAFELRRVDRAANRILGRSPDAPPALAEVKDRGHVDYNSFAPQPRAAMSEQHWASLRKPLENTPVHDEASGLDTLYRRRFEAPELARKWLLGEGFEYYEDDLASAGDPRARRNLVLRLERMLGDDESDAVNHAFDVALGLSLRKPDPFLTPSVLEQLHEKVLQAVTSDLTEPFGAWDRAILVAQRRKWDDVIQAYIDNPTRLAALVLPGTRLDGSPHPALEDIEAPSRLQASATLAPDWRLAHICAAGLVANWEKTTRTTVERDLDQPSANSVDEMVTTAVGGVQKPIAAAWMRCRLALAE